MKLFVLVWKNRITSTNQHGSVNETMTTQSKCIARIYCLVRILIYLIYLMVSFIYDKKYF